MLAIMYPQVRIFNLGIEIVPILISNNSSQKFHLWLKKVVNLVAYANTFLLSGTSKKTLYMISP